MKQAKIGLLPLYIKLYDDFSQGMRAGIDPYHDEIAGALKNQNLEVVRADVCRIKPEFEKAIALFEKENVDAIVTLHLAYSPSLESIEAIANTKLPVIVLDTTKDYEFDFNVYKGAVSYNHGIHGVQDFCSMLRRYKKDFSLFAGHYENSDVIKNVADAARAISASKTLAGSKVGRIGGEFKGMGDFAPSCKAMEKLGITVVECDGEQLDGYKNAVTDEQIKKEYDADCKNHGALEIDYEVYSATERVGLAVREWIKKQNLDAFTMNFLGAASIKGFDTMPFAEACKQLSFGVGYAGEGDVLTASIVGALSKVYPDVNFVEMFCPDWKNGTIYMSHMGECNLNHLENTHMVVKNFPYTDAFNPTSILGNMKAGKGCIVNIIPNADDWFDMVIVGGEMLQLPEKIENLYNSINGWFKPTKDVATLLAQYSELGGTHHSAFVYDVDSKALMAFAKALDIKCTVI